MKPFNLFFISILSIAVSNAFAAKTMSVEEMETIDPLAETVEQILERAHNSESTKCASAAFLRALENNVDAIEESDPEHAIKLWAHQSMTSNKDTLTEVLECPELAKVDDYTTVHFSPITFEFPKGRSITINYATQKKVLKQKLDLTNKRLSFDEEGNPKLMDPNDPYVYINTEPAWYAIMVVQHDALKDFVGPDKNNTLSMKFIENNIDKLYPLGASCTSRSAIANDSDTINQVVHKVVNMEGIDGNDYYVAGDVNLEWIMYAEIAADIFITVATAGTGKAVTAGTQAAREARTIKEGIKAAKNMKDLRKFKNVDKYVTVNQQLDRIEAYKELYANYQTLDNATDIAKAEQELQDAFKYIKKYDSNITEAMLRDPDKYNDVVKGLNKTVNELTNVSEELANTKVLMEQARRSASSSRVKEFDRTYEELNKLRDSQESMVTISHIKNPDKKAKALEKYNQQQERIHELEAQIRNFENSADVGDYAKYKQEVDNLESVGKYKEKEGLFTQIDNYEEELNQFRKTKKYRTHTGNVFTRDLKGIKHFKEINSTLKNANRTIRANMSSKSSRIGSWLYDNTLKFGSYYGKYKYKLGKAYGAFTLGKMALDLYDHTSETSNEYTNGIDFKPLCLLSADDIPGEDNVVNYGMWLMWHGNSTDPYDDDAAYLQAVDFASKFAYQMDEHQKENEANCDIDIYVVRPIIRLAPDATNDSDGELLYLVMNDSPWYVAGTPKPAEEQPVIVETKPVEERTIPKAKKIIDIDPSKLQDLGSSANDAIPDLRPGAARQHPYNYEYKEPEPINPALLEQPSDNLRLQMNIPTLQQDSISAE